MLFSIKIFIILVNNIFKPYVILTVNFGINSTVINFKYPRFTFYYTMFILTAIGTDLFASSATVNIPLAANYFMAFVQIN